MLGRRLEQPERGSGLPAGTNERLQLAGRRRAMACRLGWMNGWQGDIHTDYTDHISQWLKKTRMLCRLD